MSIRTNAYTELEQMRARNLDLQKELMRREIADAIAARKKLDDDQAAIVAAASEARRVERESMLETARKSAWKNHFTMSAVAGGNDAFIRYLDRPGIELQREADEAIGWPAGTSPLDFEITVLVPEPEPSDELANTTIGKAMAAARRKTV